MFDKIQCFYGENPDVKKYVFEKEDICVEAVLYKYGSYEKRTVLCVSTQCGCPVGCTFCGTGKKFIRNLTADEIVEQIGYVISEVQKEIGYDSINSRCEKFQIMFMSMGEPMLNWINVSIAIRNLHGLYPNAQLLISTMGVKDPEVFMDICKLSQQIDKVGLQFSVHETNDYVRDSLIPFKNKLNLRELRDTGMIWNKYTGRQVFLNFCVPMVSGLERIYDLFSPSIFALTFSVICEKYEGRKKDEVKNLEQALLYTVTSQAIAEGYNVRAFDPAGQDDIGGGCGQLWYVQDWMKIHGK